MKEINYPVLSQIQLAEVSPEDEQVWQDAFYYIQTVTGMLDSLHYDSSKDKWWKLRDTYRGEVKPRLEDGTIGIVVTNKRMRYMQYRGQQTENGYLLAFVCGKDEAARLWHTINSGAQINYEFISEAIKKMAEKLHDIDLVREQPIINFKQASQRTDFGGYFAGTVIRVCPWRIVL